MSASLDPNCNEVKEWVVLFDSQFEVINRAPGVMIRAFSSGTVKVRNSPPELGVLTDLLGEYLRGKGTTDECAPLFKDYKACLAVEIIPLSVLK